MVDGTRLVRDRGQRLHAVAGNVRFRADQTVCCVVGRQAGCGRAGERWW